MTLAELRELAHVKHCRWDGAKLPQTVDYYYHPDGWTVDEFSRPQWLSIRCPKCGYDWSLMKLGVPREPILIEQLRENRS